MPSGNDSFFFNVLSSPHRSWPTHFALTLGTINRSISFYSVINKIRLMAVFFKFRKFPLASYYFCSAKWKTKESMTFRRGRLVAKSFEQKGIWTIFVEKKPLL